MGFESAMFLQKSRQMFYVSALRESGQQPGQKENTQYAFSPCCVTRAIFRSLLRPLGVSGKS